MAVIQNECNPQIVRRMIAHLRDLMEDAVYHGWEPVKQAHSDILSCIEMGEFTWFDDLKLVERRRSALNRALKLKDGNHNVLGAKSTFQGQSWGQGRQFNSNFKVSGGMGKKLVKPCVYFNNGSCVKKGDHDEVNVFL
jgi:hypothetical protein